MSTMASAGIPDLHAIVDGRAVWIELKAVVDWPRGPDANVLSHRFTGPQLAFLAHVDRARGRGLGVIGWQEEHKWLCTILRVHDIGAEGTVSRREIDRHPVFRVDNGRRLAQVIRRC